MGPVVASLKTKTLNDNPYYKYMEQSNSFYVLADATEKIEAEKLHICTWDVKGQNTFVEIGICIKVNDDTPEKVKLYVSLPFLNGKCTYNSLHEQLNVDSNFRFIFNTSFTNKQNIGGDERGGSIFTIEENGSKFAIVNANCQIECGDKMLCFILNKPDDTQSVYARVLIKTDCATLANTVSGITKKDYLFDVKVNEARNMPDDVFKFKTSKNLKLVNIENAFCLHAIPEYWNITFSDPAKLKNVRRLEIEAFKKYMSWIEKIDDEYIITFSKAACKNGCSFFTIFTHEHIGNMQLCLAIFCNLICSLLFGFYSYRADLYAGGNTFPVEFLIAIALIFITILALTGVQNRLVKWIKRKFKH